jgi:hypothetical protein
MSITRVLDDVTPVARLSSEDRHELSRPATPPEDRPGSLDPGPLLMNGPTILEDSSSMDEEGDCTQERSIGAVHLTGEEISTLFDEYYSQYHNLLPLFVRTHDPDELYEKNSFIFWVICLVGSRPRSLHPLVRCRTNRLCIALGRGIQTCFHHLLLNEKWNHWHVQAFLLLAQYPPIHEQDWKSVAWVSVAQQN